MGAIWISLLILIIILLLTSSINIGIAYCRREHNDNITVTVSAFLKLINLKYTLDTSSLALLKRLIPDEGAFGEFSIKFYTENILNYIRKYKRVEKRIRPSFNYAIKRIRIKNLTWHSVLGAGDAATTGFLIGLMWNLKTLSSLLINVLFKSYFYPDFKIKPQYDRTVFSTDFHCILSIKTGHAIIAGIIFLVKGKKDGVKGGRTSYRSVNENYNG